ncbi:MAG: hypothetical protein QGD94_11870, partial [Planctomycetia bacterium]|nr:hypothetical protein [Planctomycetia bacterium]
MLRIRATKKMQSAVACALALALLAPPLLLAAAGKKDIAARKPAPRAAQAQRETFGAEPNLTGDPIGGGRGYRRIVKRFHHRVATAKGLLSALARARKGEVVYVMDTAEIDLTGKKNIIIPAGVTLASGRGRAKGKKLSKGALIFCDEKWTKSLFRTGGPGVRVTGLRIRGPDPTRQNELTKRLIKEGTYNTVAKSTAIWTSHPRLEVDNCELSAWSFAAVRVGKGGFLHFHHNYTHHCQRWGKGYAVCLSRGQALIEGNLFDWHRHAVAGVGYPEEAYEARYNIYLANSSNHIFDMHGGGDRGDGTTIAGKKILIHHNTVINTEWPPVIIRGRPVQPSEVHHNWWFAKKRGWAKQNIGWCVMQLG